AHALDFARQHRLAARGLADDAPQLANLALGVGQPAGQRTIDSTADRDGCIEALVCHPVPLLTLVPAAGLAPTTESARWAVPLSRPGSSRCVRPAPALPAAPRQALLQKTLVRLLQAPVAFQRQALDVIGRHLA